MNTKTLVSFKMDKSLRDSAKEVAEEIGIPFGTIVNALVRQFVRTKEVRLSSEYNPTPFLRSVIAEGMREYEGDKGNLKKFKSVEDLIKNLES